MHNHGIGGWMVKRRLQTPDRVAVVFGEQEITYRELADRADRLCGMLFDRGIAKGDRIAFLGENSPAFLETLFGAATLGAVFVPINTRLAPGEVGHILRDSGALMLFHDAELDELAAASLDGTDVRYRVVMGDGAADLPTGPDVERYLEAVAGPQPGHLDPEITLDDDAMIMYTSGTTGRSKGAVLTHGNFTWNAMNVIIDYDVVTAEVMLAISPLFHAAAMGQGVMPAIMKGATLVLEPRFEAGLALDLIERHRVTMLSGVPTTYQLMADHERWATTDLSSLEKLTCGGSAIPARIVEAYEERGIQFSLGYGMTEATPAVTCLQRDMSRAKQGTVGLGHFFTDIRVVDEHGALVQRGSVGEIEIQGPNIMSRYHGLPEATAAAFSDDGWFKSGDMGYLDADGYLTISDRLKDMIISGGENIYPAEVEQHIASLDEVSGVAVIGIPDDRWGEVPIAIVALRDGRERSAESIVAALDGLVARYKVPKRVEFVDELPRTASGKVRKADLRRRFAS